MKLLPMNAKPFQKSIPHGLYEWEKNLPKKMCIGTEIKAPPIRLWADVQGKLSVVRFFCVGKLGAT